MRFVGRAATTLVQAGIPDTVESIVQRVLPFSPAVDVAPLREQVLDAVEPAIGSPVRQDESAPREALVKLAKEVWRRVVREGLARAKESVVDLAGEHMSRLSVHLVHVVVDGVKPEDLQAPVEGHGARPVKADAEYHSAPSGFGTDAMRRKSTIISLAPVVRSTLEPVAGSRNGSTDPAVQTSADTRLN